MICVISIWRLKSMFIVSLNRLCMCAPTTLLPLWFVEEPATTPMSSSYSFTTTSLSTTSWEGTGGNLCTESSRGRRGGASPKTVAGLA